MKEKLPELVRKSQFPLLIASVAMPLLLVINVISAPGLLYLSWLFAGLYVVFTIGSLFVPGKRRLLYGGICTAAMLLFAFFLTNRLECPGFIIGPAILAVLLMLSLRMAGWTWAEELPDFWYWTGLAFHVAIQILLFFGKVWQAYALLEISGHTIVAFFIFIVLMLLSMSRSSMIIAAMGRHKASDNMRRKSLSIVAIFFAVVLVIAFVCSPAVLPAIAWIKSVIAWIQNLLPKEEPGETYATETVETTEEYSNEYLNSEPNPFFKWLQELFMTAFDFLVTFALPLILIALAVSVLVLLFKLIRFLINKLTRYAEAAGEDYEDIITDTREEGQKESLGDRIRNSEIFVNESRLTPAERIRLYYRRLMRKHPEWSRSTTARENLPHPASDYYEQARYGAKDLSAKEADSFASDTKNL